MDLIQKYSKLEELSKATLASYAKKAVSDARFKQGIGKDYEALGKRKRDQNTKAAFANAGRKYRMKAQSRETGAAKAIDRLAKEEVDHMTENVFYNSGESANKKPVGKGTIVKNTRTGIVGKAHSWSVVKGVPHLHVKSDNDSYHSPTKDWQVIDKKKDEPKKVKEEVALDEISSMAHAKYRSAARADIKAQSKMLDADSKASDRIQKRVDGLARSTGLERVKKMTKEEVVQKYLNVEQTDDVPFKADKPKQSATPGKYGVGYSTARHLARQALQSVMKDIKKGPEKGKRQVS